ncbi:cell cycle control protein [Histoplasma capsulatum G186AR]|uniref:Cell cycle control protein n=1 Tax=Ajellomyces capsulatus (strain G186AR / H82 / ATCC MYA-2454 / RMSCC 2432) TaxID=447093 RepID=C0NKN5_AJECG|nr:cell cycle control protein [Histoplasma capsulatum G186AR]EEH08426.1 cell cycle control protein [Histoplasma capsulatum G186AR]
MSAPRTAKRQRRLVVLSSDDEEVNNGTQNHENVKKDEEGEDDDYVESGRRRNVQLKERINRGVKRKITPVPKGTVACPSRTEASTAIPAVAVAPKLITNTLPTCLLQKQTQKRTQKPSSSQQKRPGQPRSLQTTPGSSPEKKRGKKTHSRPEEPSKSLHSFFAKATEEERWSRKKDSVGLGAGVGSSVTEETDLVEEIEDDDKEEEIVDFIEDDSYEELFASHIFSSGSGNRVQGGNKTGLHLDRRKANDMKGRQHIDTTKSTSGLGRRFLLPGGTSTAHGVEPSRARDSTSPTQLFTRGIRPWAEEYAPTDLDELVRVLVLRGPAGSGKSTTISILSNTIGFEIVEWKSPLGSEFSSQGYVSMGAQFEDFLGRSDKFGSLFLSGGGREPSHSATHGNSDHLIASTTEKRRVILVEEFPSSLNQSSSGLRAFRLALQSYLVTATPRQPFDNQFIRDTNISSPPLIMIVSETMLGWGGISSDSFTVHRLLGPEISSHPSVSIIDFNRVAPTFMSKAIDLVLKKEARRSKRKRVPGPEVLKAFAQMGDIRSAISALEFMCLRGEEDTNWSGTVAGRMKRPSRGGIPLTSMEKESLEMVTQREASLGIFHAVGKVVYNKREDPTISHGLDPQLPQPPRHLQSHARPKASLVSIDDLINETGTDLQTFIAALHENYLLSCTGPAFADHFEKCISYLSETDILGPSSRFHNTQTNRGGVGLARSSYQGFGSSIDMLRQNEISFQVAVRGLLFSLPFPVKRKAPTGMRAGDAHKMFFPTSMRLWRQNEELDGLLDLWMRRLTDPTTGMSSGTTIPRLDGVESWKNHRWADGSSNHDHGHGSAGDTSAYPSHAARAMISREEILLERLPYLRLISRNPLERRELEKMTQFSGVGGPSEEEFVDVGIEDTSYGGGSAMDPWSAPADKDVISPQKQRQGIKLGQVPASKPFAPQLAIPVQEAVEKLVLSDDDIEDE